MAMSQLFLACVFAVLAFAAAGINLRGSAFVPSSLPCKPSTSMMGSLQNAPNHAGKLLGVPVGTAKQRKQAMLKFEEEHKVAVEANRQKKADLNEARAARDKAGLEKAVAASEAKK